MRIGIGYDVHRFAPGRPLILGGVHVPHDSGLLGHSDADVLTHAVCDALLGAAALGDIGRHFPDSDERYADADSILLLERVAAMLHDADFAVGNVDVTVAIESPRLSPYVDGMRERLAGALGMTKDRVSVKATTTEGLGFVGVKEGIAAYAVCTLMEAEKRP